ncbi:MAG: nitroreductase family protein [Rudaea sp.]
MVTEEKRALFDLIRSRRSIRRYDDHPVPREVIDELLEAARWAPSAHNRQPWRFAIVESVETRRALGASMGARLRADLERDGASREVIEADVTRSFSRITGAPVVVVVCMTMKEMDHYVDAGRQQAERTMATESVAMAVQNLLLAAHANGLGACWMCAPLFVPDLVRQVLGLDPDWEPQALITLGWPAESRSKTRRPLAEIIRFLDPA